MSKYYKAEDVINTLADQYMFEATMDSPYASNDINDYLENAKLLFSDLPTIEVSEDAISREDAVNALIAHFIPQTYTGEQVEQASKLARKIMANAPSVIPQPKEGEWIIEEKDSIYGKKIRLTCSECGDVFDVTETALPYERYCRYCGSKMKGADNEDRR